MPRARASSRFGDTHVLCVATVEERVPPFLRNTGKGWVTAEYGMLPRSTNTRMAREAARGKQSGRTQEIQRLIGRSLRAVTRLDALGERQVILDCDVLQADGGTRTASITGAYVALHQALAKLVATGALPKLPLREPVAAVSCGIVGGTAVLDLDYVEDSGAQADANFVLSASGGIVEVQVTAEEDPDRRRAVRGDARAGRRRDRRAGGPAAADARMLIDGRRLLVATHNPGKLREFEYLLEPHGIEVVGAAALGLPEPEETGDSFRANARLKARAAADATGLPALADDSGIVVHGLDGAPASTRPAGPARSATSISRSPRFSTAWSSASAASPPLTGAPRSSRCCAWPARTPATGSSRVASTARCWIRRGVPAASATTRSSSPTATPGPSRR